MNSACTDKSHFLDVPDSNGSGLADVDTRWLEASSRCCRCKIRFWSNDIKSKVHGKYLNYSVGLGFDPVMSTNYYLIKVRTLLLLTIPVKCLTMLDWYFSRFN